MVLENEIGDRIKELIERDNSYMKYTLRSEDERGELEFDGERLETPYWSFGEISRKVRDVFEESNEVIFIEPIGFRGEVLISKDKELEIYATGSAGYIEYRVRPRGS